MRFLFFFCLTFLVQTSLLSQEKFTLSGYMTDASSGEAIIGGKAYIKSINQGAVTNVYGFYSLTVPAGTYEVELQATGLATQKITFDLTKDIVHNVEFSALAIEEVEISAIRKDENVSSTKVGSIELKIEEIKTLPAFMGEVDLIKAIQLLPGVSSVSEGGQGFYVRGGGPDQNLVLVDEATVYNAAHLFGFFSVFNADAVKSVNLTKGGIPANFGGRMSSVLEVNMKEGNMKEFHVKGGIGLIASRLTVEGPLKKDKGSFIVSARRTYIDLLMKAFIPDSSNFSGSSYYFYDLNAKFNYKINEKNRIFLSGYYGKDIFQFDNKNDGFNMKMPWGNGVASIRWNHLFSNKLFMNVIGTFTDYRFSFGSTQDDFSLLMTSGIQDYGSKVDFSYFPTSRHKIKFGADYTFHVFTPTSVSAKVDTTVFDTGNSQKLHSHETGIYFLDEFDITENFKINAGLRYSTYTQVGEFTRYIKGNLSTPDTSITYGKGDVVKFYHGLEPRLSMRYLLPDNSAIKGGFSYNYQYVHLASFSAVSLPTDIWYPATDKAKPQIGWQGSLGYFRNFLNNMLETSVEVYYKGMNNLIEFKEGAIPGDQINDNVDNLMTFGKGWSYGIEFFIRKTAGKFTGWIGYTLAKTDRKFPELNNGNIYPAKYDRRHDLSVVASYKLNDHWTFGGTFIFATGNTLTLPASWYVLDQTLLFNYGARNSTRMAPYHRLDIAATWYDKAYKINIDPATGNEIQVKKRFRNSISISVYNVYNRANPLFVYVDNNGSFLGGDFKLTVKQVTLFPIIPGIMWNFEF